MKKIFITAIIMIVLTCILTNKVYSQEKGIDSFENDKYIFKLMFDKIDEGSAKLYLTIINKLTGKKCQPKGLLVFFEKMLLVLLLIMIYLLLEAT